MLASKNLPKPITQPSDGHQWIRVLAAELALRLNDARESMPTLWPKTIVLHARKGDLILHHRMLHVELGTHQDTKRRDPNKLHFLTSAM
jgi:hypothetical protein